MVSTGTRPIDSVLACLEGVRKTGSGFLARCPAHADRTPSLSIREGDDGRVLFYCFAGCTFEQIIDAAGLEAGDLFPDKRPPDRPRRIVATYDYRDERDAVQFQVVRLEPKGFAQRHSDGTGGWAWGLNGQMPILYHLPELHAADPNRRVILCEGEKDADRLAPLGFLATTAPMGAGKWRDTYTETLRGRHVVILPDNDTPGRDHAATIARSLHGIAASVKVVALPGLPPKGDVSDYLDQGHSKDDLIREMQAAPDWRPGEHDQATSDDPATPRAPVLIVTSLADVEPEETEWIWEHRIPRGKLTLLGGHPGVGKSTITAYLAAAHSRGERWPDGATNRAGNTLFLIAEDDIADTLRPRLDWHGADVSRIFAVEAVQESDGKRRLFHLDRHLDLLREQILRHHIDLLVIDPLSAFMSTADRNAEGDVRDLLTPLGQFADESAVAIVGLMHVGKPSGGSQRTSLQQLLGATAFGAVARVVMMAAEIPPGDDDDPAAPGRHLFGVVKSNVSIKPVPLEWSHPLDQPICWHGESQLDLDDVLAGMKEAPIEEAKAFLREELKGGSKTVAGLRQAAKGSGISFATLKRAKQAMGVEHFKVHGEMHGPWHWRLSTDAHDRPSDSSPPRGTSESDRSDAPSHDESLATDSTLGNASDRSDARMGQAKMSHLGASVGNVRDGALAGNGGHELPGDAEEF